MSQTSINPIPETGNKNLLLIEACRRGDQRAQLQVYKLYYKPVYNICLRLVNDPVAAEDIMHESFLSAFENINNYPGNINFFDWLLSFINKSN